MMVAPEIYIISVTDVLGNEVKLSKTKWDSHITTGHPEIRGQLRKVETTIKAPEIIVDRSDRNTYIYITDTVTSNYFNVLTNSTTGLVRTVYTTTYLLDGDIIYKRK